MQGPEHEIHAPLVSHNFEEVARLPPEAKGLDLPPGEDPIPGSSPAEQGGFGLGQRSLGRLKNLPQEEPEDRCQEARAQAVPPRPGHGTATFTLAFAITSLISATT